MSNEEVLDKQDIERLEMTQVIRERYINEIAGSEDGPADNGERTFLVNLLNGMDKAVLSKSKIKAQVQGNKVQEETSKLIATALFQHKVDTSVERTEKVVLPSDVPEPVIVDGELEQGVSTLTYSKFVLAQGPQLNNSSS